MQSIEAQIDGYMEEAIEIRRQLHRRPELGMKEVETTALVRKKLTEYGVMIEDLELETGVSALIRGGKPGRTIALRADMDALPMTEESGLSFSSEVPGVCHSCGHDLHTAYLLLVSRILKGHRAALSGNVRLLFQPAEELGSGAKYMIEKGVMEREPKVNEIIGIHVATELPAGYIGLIKGPASAGCDQIHVTVRGKGGHGAHPSRCVDPIVVSAYLIAQLQTLVSREVSPFQPAVLTFGKIQGGTAANVIPETVTFSGTLRTFSHETRTQIKDAILRTCGQHCKSMRAEADVIIEDGIPPLIHDGEIVDGLADAATQTIRPDHVIWLPQPNSSSDDFSVYLDHCPGVRYRVGTHTDDPRTKAGAHNPGVVFDENAIRTAALVTCRYILNRLG